MITRKGLAAGLNTKSCKIGDEEIAFTAKKEFPSGKFPTKKKTAIERLLWEKNWHTKDSEMRFLEEIINIWVFCSISNIKVICSKESAGIGK